MQRVVGGLNGDGKMLLCLHGFVLVSTSVGKEEEGSKGYGGEAVKEK